MKDILSGWREHGLLKSKYMLIISIVIVLIITISGVMYYLHYKKTEKEALEKQQQQLILNDKKKITNFYLSQFHGYQADDLIIILKQILLSSYAFTASGFNEDMFTCNEDNCQFSYKLKPGAIFNVQDKFFFNERYEGIISPDSLDFSNLQLKYTDNRLENKITSPEEKLHVPTCNDYINYVYAYNSSKDNEKKKIKLNELPSSSVSNIESKYSGYPDSHNLLFAKFEMTFKNNPLEISYLLNGQPYIDYYVFKSIEKLDVNNIKVTGVFACKR
ncbi:hypothetical protein AB6H97_000567 [Providencia rettgeri]